MTAQFGVDSMAHGGVKNSRVFYQNSTCIPTQCKFRYIAHLVATV